MSDEEWKEYFNTYSDKGSFISNEGGMVSVNACSKCGALVLWHDEELHIDWHRSVAPDASRPLVVGDLVIFDRTNGSFDYKGYIHSITDVVLVIGKEPPEPGTDQTTWVYKQSEVTNLRRVNA